MYFGASFSLDEILSQASGFGDAVSQGATGNSGDFLDLTEMFQGITDLVFDIGNLVILIAIVFTGLRYVWSGVEGKASIKESLINMSTGVIFFYVAQGIYDVSARIFLKVGTSDFDTAQGIIWDNVAIIVKVAALIGLIAVGLRYMLNSADTKADIKKQLLPVVIGLVLIFCVTSVAELIVGFGKDAIGSEGTRAVEGLTEGGNADATVKNAMGTIFSTLSVVFQILAVAAVVFTGLRFMFASADTRADIKGQTIILILGAVIVFGAVEIIKTIQSSGEKILGGIESDIVIARTIDE